MLAYINIETDEEIAQLTGLAEEFAGAVPGFYSVDFAQKADGQWVLIDAARVDFAQKADGQWVLIDAGGELSWEDA